MAKRCAECLFSTNRIVSSTRAAKLIRECVKKDAHFLCHKGTIVGEEVTCRGFYDAYPTQMIRIARRLRVVQFIEESELSAKKQES